MAGNLPDGRALRDAFGLFATGVTVVTGSKPDGEPVGVTANSFSSVSLSPPMILWCLQNESSSIGAFAVGRAFAVHVLAADQEHEAMHFARRAGVKFAPGFALAQHDRPPGVEGAICRFDCIVEALHPGGDHLIVLGSVKAFESRGGEPLAFQGGVFGRFVARREARHVEAWESFNGDWF